MEPHTDKGRYIVSQAILMSNKTSPTIRSTALKCILAYKDSLY
jgi:hypothetical protein